MTSIVNLQTIQQKKPGFLKTPWLIADNNSKSFSDFSPITHAYGFFADRTWLAVSLRQAALTESLVYFSCVVAHASDLMDFGLICGRDDEDVARFPGRTMSGSGSCHLGIAVLMTPERRKRVLKKTNL